MLAPQPLQQGAGCEGLSGMTLGARTASQPLPPFPHAPPARTLSCDPSLSMSEHLPHGSSFPLGGGAPHPEGLTLHAGRSHLDDIMW